MMHMRLWAAAAIIAVFIIAGFLLSAPRAHNVVPTSAPVATTTQAVPVVTLHDAYRRGVHTITGSVLAPDACAVVTATSTLAGTASTTESILVSVSLPADMGVCLDLPTETSFSTSIVAPKGLPVSAVVNGIPATTTPS